MRVGGVSTAPVGERGGWRSRGEPDGEMPGECEEGDSSPVFQSWGELCAPR